MVKQSVPYDSKPKLLWARVGTCFTRPYPRKNLSDHDQASMTVCVLTRSLWRVYLAFELGIQRRFLDRWPVIPQLLLKLRHQPFQACHLGRKEVTGTVSTRQCARTVLTNNSQGMHQLDLTFLRRPKASSVRSSDHPKLPIDYDWSDYALHHALGTDALQVHYPPATQAPATPSSRLRKKHDLLVAR